MEIAWWIKFAYQAAGRLASVNANLKGAKVVIIGAHNFTEIDDFIRDKETRRPRKIKEIHIVNSRSSEFKRLESQIIPALKKRLGKSFPHIYGWQENMLELYEELADADLIFHSFVIDQDYFDSAQILQIERQIIARLKVGGIHIANGFMSGGGIRQLMGNAALGMKHLGYFRGASYEIKLSQSA